MEWLEFSSDTVLEPDTQYFVITDTGSSRAVFNDKYNGLEEWNTGFQTWEVFTGKIEYITKVIYPKNYTYQKVDWRGYPIN